VFCKGSNFLQVFESENDGWFLNIGKGSNGFGVIG